MTQDTIVPKGIGSHSRNSITMLVHNIVSPKYHKIQYKSQPIEFVKKYKYFEVTISTKLGWEIYINETLRKISRIYNAMRITCRSFKKKDIKIRKNIFLAFALPHYLWLLVPLSFSLNGREKEILIGTVNICVLYIIFSHGMISQRF